MGEFFRRICRKLGKRNTALFGTGVSVLPAQSELFGASHPGVEHKLKLAEVSLRILRRDHFSQTLFFLL
jgi:hypothetical protein